MALVITIRYYCKYRQYNKNKNREVVVLPKSLKHYSSEIVYRSGKFKN